MNYYDTLNPANDYATGDAEGPTREEIEDAVLDFDDANNGLSAQVRFERYPDYEITVTVEGGAVLATFDRLWEFEDWQLKQALELDRLVENEMAGIMR